MEKGDWKYSAGLLVIIAFVIFTWKTIICNFLPWFFSREIVLLIFWSFPKWLFTRQIIKEIILCQAVTFIIYCYVKKGRISFFVWPYE